MVPSAEGWRSQLDGDVPELLLLEVTRGVPQGWSGDPQSLRELVVELAARQVPLVVHARDDVPLPEWLQTPLSVLVLDPGTSRPQGASEDLVVITAPPSVSPRALATLPPRAADSRRPGIARAPGTELAAGVVSRLAGAPTVDVAGTTSRPAVPGEHRAVLASASTPATELLMAALHATPIIFASAGPDDRATTLDDLVHHATGAAEIRAQSVAYVNQTELVDREGLRLRRAVLTGLTVRDRVDDILDGVGITVDRAPRDVSAVVPTNRTHEISNVLRNAGRQERVDLQLVLVLHGLDLDESAVRREATEQGVQNLEIVHASADLTLGACMNLGVDASDGSFIAKMDDDNYYGPQFAADLIDAFRYTDAQITGKWAHYVWLRSTGAVVLRYPASENAYERRVQGGSMMFQGDLVRSLRFGDLPRAVDSDILDRAMAEGASIYSADRFNFVSVRGTDRTQHTWTVSDATFFTAKGDLRFFGDPTEHVTV
ncbi:hypothetical protein [Oerskovia flava]|uniref:hypothetical protein n=1 Tax=Oerskovia flava TaxID=2986422 RepID=UPI002240C734|nr:hypothetical protein [Oerskovia sp. JB1-3-2]